jgi:D-alanyl-D-alanine carboxypeptidase
VRRGPLTIYATLLGSPDRATRNADLARLLRFGISRYRTVEAVAAGQVYGRVRLPLGRPSVPVVTERPLVRVVRVDRPLVQRVVVPAAASLPVRRGQPLGEVRLYEGSRLVGRRDLVAARSVSRPDFAGRVRWYARRTVHHLWGLIA